MNLGKEIGRELNSKCYRGLHQFTSYHHLERKVSKELWSYLDERIWDRVIDIAQLASNGVDDSKTLEEE